MGEGNDFLRVLRRGGDNKRRVGHSRETREREGRAFKAAEAR